MYASAIMTAPRQIDYLPETLESLEAAGIGKPMIISDGIVSRPTHHWSLTWRLSECRLGIVPTFRRAVHALIAAGTDRIAIFQDDVSCHQDLRNLDRQLPVHRGIFSLYLTPARTAPEGWSEIESEGYPLNVGGCGFMMDRMTAMLLVDSKPFPRIDRLGSQLALWARSVDIPFYVHSPSILIHRGEIRCRN